jgi:UDP-N-acetylglucosamine acyltransferase
MPIHETAVIDKNAHIGKNNHIGPYVVIESGVKLGDNNRIGPGAIITGNTTIGNDNIIHGHVYIGNTPQDVSYDGAHTMVLIGDRNEFREFTNIHRGTKEGTATVIGSDNYFMVSSHIAHNCTIGNHIFMVNGASLGGYCEVHDHAFLSAYVIAHQFVRIGAYSICGILTKLTKDVPPFMMVDGNPASVHGLNVVGLKRKGFSSSRRAAIKKAYKILYRCRLSLKSALDRIDQECFGSSPEPEAKQDLQLLIDFIKSSKRGVLLRPPAQAAGQSAGQSRVVEATE